jgi:hypothetical protein
MTVHPPVRYEYSKYSTIGLYCGSGHRGGGCQSIPVFLKFLKRQEEFWWNLTNDSIEVQIPELSDQRLWLGWF